MYLEKINEPQDLKNMNIEELNKLADEMRSHLINKLSRHGGHIGPNLGMIEMSIAMHYVFSSPTDKFVFDVSHQCYPHKMLTGRKEAFMEEAHYDDVTGYTNPEESTHDMFTVGHTSTSVSLALGLAKGRDLNKRKENIIPIIGDGSLSGGEALEALDYAGEYTNNLIIIVNDNDQSIAENHGGLYKSLKQLRESNGNSSCNLFKSFGLDYKYLENGHDIKQLIELFESVKDIDHPIVLHIHTIKGKGLPYAEQDRETWHAGGPFKIEDGSRPQFEADTTLEDSIMNLLDNNDKAIAINAATPMAMGFLQTNRPAYVKRGQFIDVGIAEENAVAMLSGIAKNGGTPVMGVYAPFLQRTYDQLSSDLCLNNNPAVILELAAGIYGMNSNTHLGIWDIALISHIPNLIMLAPTSKEEYLQMFKYATTQKNHPVLIRVPAQFIATGIADTTDYSILNKAAIINEGSDIAIIGVSNMLTLAKEVAKAYKEETGHELTVINPRFLSGLDTDLLEALKQNHKLVITLEDGQLDGGYGYRVASFYGDSEMKVKNFGIAKGFPSDFEPAQILADNGMSVPQLLNYIKMNH